MNTASLELCKELYELSGWEETEWGYNTCPGTDGGIHNIRDVVHLMKNTNSEFICPAYTLGFLLRKLPQYIDDYGEMFNLSTRQGSYRDGWMASYDDEEGQPVRFEACADTPEDAVCKLAIELFKQGVLKK